MKFKKWLNKVTKIFVVLGMVLSMCFTAGNTNTVEAWDSGIPHEFTRIKSITYPEWWKRKCPQITKQWSTYMCKYNGQWSYCLEASKKTPSSGNYAASVIENNVMVRKFLYYGFGGPNGSLFKGQALTDDGLNEEETGYLYTHVLLSLAYSGDMCGANIDDLERAGIGLKSTWSYVESLPDPSNGANFSTGDTAKFTATFDKANMIQTTNTVSFNASSNETVQLPLQSNVTIHIAGSSAQQTGGTATVWGGQSFYLTAPLENSPTDYTSGTLNSSAKGKFCALAISDGNGSNQTHGSWTQESVDSLRYSVDWLDFGWIDLIKKSANEGITNNNGCYSLEGAVYGIYSDGVKVDEITTDKNGYAKSSILPVGNYTVKEITASTGYDLDENTYSVTVVKDQNVRANSNETPGNDPIGIEVVKNDAETKGMPQGDATLEGAEFTVKYYDGYYTKDDLPKKATRTWVIATKEVTYSTGKKGYVARLSNSNKVSGDNFYTDENGAITLPLGTISIEETKAPKGYLLKGNTLNVTDNLTGVTTTEKDTNYVAQITKEYQGAKLQFGNDANQMVVTEKVKKQQIQIFKSGYRNGMSEVVKGLQGAEFTFKLKSEVDHVGWDNATVYDTITTGEDGWAITKDLPYGQYIVRETKTPKDFYTNPDFFVSVTKDTSEIKNDADKVKKVILNNRPVETQLKLVKQDEETGKTVSLNSASFKIVADEDILDGGNIVYKKGEYITQKVGGKKYDTFTTNSDNVVVVKTEYTNDDDEKGEVFLPLQFFAGKYHLEEVKVPTGFIGLGKTQSFEMSGLLDYTKDEDGDPIYTVKVRDEQPKAQIKLNKTVADLDTDVDLVDRSDLSKIQFVLKAKENIYSPVDGSLMFAKDDVITTENSGAIVNSGTEVGNGVYALSTDGHLDISNLPMGVGEAQYYLQEVKTLDGCILDTTKYDAVFKQSDYTTKTYIKSFDVENLTTDFEFNKTDVTGDKEVEGAQLTITDEDGNVVDQWTSTDKVHSIEGLVVGKTYTLSETVTAKDYVKATDIKFTVKNSSELETVTMKDKQVSFTKTDVTGEKEVEGAEITVTDKETGKVVDKWTSGKDSHFINGLEEGRTYILSETVSPEEYVKSTDIEFTVSKEKVNEKVNMKDKQVKVSKLTVGGEEVTGAHMQIIDEDGNVVDEWYSEGKSHIANGLEEGKTYTLHEDLSPLGFNLANDFTFEVTKEKENQTVEMIDTVTEVNKTDVDGKAVKEATLSIVSEKTKDIVDQWVTGQHIIDLDKDVKAQLEENGKAEGTYMDEEDSMVMFSIAKNKDRDDYTLMQVKDGVTTYANIDIKGNETNHRVQGLVAGEKYILRETKTPEEYVQAKEIEFTAGEDEDQTLVMQDKQVTISKITVSGDEVTGALMQIKDEDGNIIDEWTSEGKVHYATGLVEGKKYTLHEDLAPTGLNLANDIEFEVTYDKENQKVEMIDTINEVSKVDEKGNLLKGAEMTVTSNKTKNIIDKWTSGQHIFDITKDMKVDLQKDGKSEGMYVDDNDSTVTYSLTANKDRKDYTLMLAKDGEVTYTNVDINGDETSHMIQGLEAGEEYVLKETKTPNGYATFKTQTFTAEEGKDTVLSMTDEDTKIEISKQDITTKKELEGAKLQVIDKDGKVIDEWTSGKQPHMIKNLTAGETYTLTEVIAPKNYKVAESIQFTVKDTGVAQKVVMYDELLPVAKKVKTGDDTRINYYVVIAVLSLIAFSLLFIRKKSHE
ncbi:SpaA isopeptide-forming pilin-related protein [Faecalibacillus intestinalis]|uniref:SpaA isopeptide-forming pilin-related protein n=1 Tax=Faecalibacillus intestinalis TaxID=1982626 RepID=UPI0032BF2A49